ncbi:NADH dehydrogenase [ubiquinone] 1 beta subcomplex subunit 2 [Trinorchestia longiramus]|nr:NADH dehydrogenase [ubiquinone] 1 beta subcomplex subunit 2 [Trinorchestia longiramus]
MLYARSPSSALQFKVEARWGVWMSVVDVWLTASVQCSSCWTYPFSCQCLRFSSLDQDSFSMLSASTRLSGLLRAAPALRRSFHSSAPMNGGVQVYRSPPAYPPKRNVILAELFGGILWFWIFYRFFNDWEMLTNEWPYPDASKWSDAELGIPPLDEEDDD